MLRADDAPIYRRFHAALFDRARPVNAVQASLQKRGRSNVNGMEESIIPIPIPDAVTGGVDHLQIKKQPALGTYDIVAQLYEHMSRDRNCNQQCLATLVENGNRILQYAVHQDKRRTRKIDIQNLHGLERAIYCINRARQMVGASTSFIRNGKRVRAGRAMLYGRASFPLGVHVVGQRRPRISACSLMFEAYRLVRDYELNPAPPLVWSDDENEYFPNPDRIQQDIYYNFIMGYQRMVPNRLGIGRRARAVWMRHGFMDPNFIPSNQPEVHNAIDSLYVNVPTDSMYGPLWVYAYYHLQSSTMLPPVAPDPRNVQHGIPWYNHFRQAVYIQELAPSLKPQLYSTDAASALLDIHQHLPQAPIVEQNPNIRPADETFPPNVLVHPAAPIEPEIIVDGTNGQRAHFYPNTVPMDGINQGNRRTVHTLIHDSHDLAAAGFWSCRDAVLKLGQAPPPLPSSRI